MGQILVTGANGFVGSALCSKLSRHGQKVRRVMRNMPAENSFSLARAGGRTNGVSLIKDIGPTTDWEGALADIDVVFHLAARVHQTQDLSVDPMKEFRRVNRDGSIALAKAAAKAGVRRLVYLSTAKVNGEGTRGSVFTEKDTPNPNDPYALSKWEAEQGLTQVAAETDLEVVVVRPPLVYGPGVKANFLRLLRVAEMRIPLPLASINNRRSLLALDNLTEFLFLCLEHPGAIGETFLISDGEDVSTPELVRLIAKHMGRSPRLIPVSPGLIRLAARLLGKKPMIDRLLGSLQIDAGKSRQILGWRPPLSMNAGIEETVRWYLEANKP